MSINENLTTINDAIDASSTGNRFAHLVVPYYKGTGWTSCTFFRLRKDSRNYVCGDVTTELISISQNSCFVNVGLIITWKTATFERQTYQLARFVVWYTSSLQSATYKVYSADNDPDVTVTTSYRISVLTCGGSTSVDCSEFINTNIQTVTCSGDQTTNVLEVEWSIKITDGNSEVSDNFYAAIISSLNCPTVNCTTVTFSYRELYESTEQALLG